MPDIVLVSQTQQFLIESAGEGGAVGRFQRSDADFAY
jgi:hypothetical protein